MGNESFGVKWPTDRTLIFNSTMNLRGIPGLVLYFALAEYSTSGDDILTPDKPIPKPFPTR